MGQSQTLRPFDPFAPDPWNAPGPVPMRALTDAELAGFDEHCATQPAEPEPAAQDVYNELTHLQLGLVIEELRRLSDRVRELEASNQRLEERLALVMDHGLAAGEKLAELQAAFVKLRENAEPRDRAAPAGAWVPIAELMGDISREFHDQAAPRVSAKRALNLFRGSGMHAEDFLQCMYAARHLTKSNSAAVKLLAESTKGAIWQQKNAVPYFFAVLESKLQGERELRDAELAL